ncbi:MAG: TFIIB-type zinc ribbon-containing protein [Planctomycetota bacterium]|jgi:Zn-finger nucleic acid-binding protein
MPPFKDMEFCGYSDEERYFHEHDTELLELKRSELDAARCRREHEEARKSHWMRCPKCGEELRGVRMGHVVVDRCTGCQGIYLDHGELELLQHVRREGVWKHLRRLVHLDRESRSAGAGRR